MCPTVCEKSSQTREEKPRCVLNLLQPPEKRREMKGNDFLKKENTEIARNSPFPRTLKGEN